MPRRLFAAVLALMLGGCVGIHRTLTSLDNQDPASFSAKNRAAFESAQSLAQDTARVYAVKPIPVRVRRLYHNAIAIYDDGQVVLNVAHLAQLNDTMVAHELGHALWRPTSAIPRIAGYEMDANAKAVEIDETSALRSVYGLLYAIHLVEVNALYPRATRHHPACVEIADLLRRFPEQREWTASLDCAEGTSVLKTPRR